jgi:3-hydroxybutyrate dehydrogenase
MLSGKAAIVTGSTSGIGLGIARALAQQGANVLLNGFGDQTEIDALGAGIDRVQDRRGVQRGGHVAPRASERDDCSMRRTL